MSPRQILDWLLSPVLDFAGDCWGANATGPVRRHPCSGFNGEVGRSVALGGGATEQPVCNAPCPDWAAGDLKSRFHAERDKR